MATKVLSTTIDENLAERLEKLARETHRKKSFYVSEALRNYFEEIEDYEIALARKGDKSVSLEKARKELGL